MKRPDKLNQFGTFLEIWESKLDKIPFILQYFNSYYNVQNKIEDTPNLSIEELYERQLQWVALVKELEHPLDKEFFKEYWVPLQSKSYDFFIDLSDSSFPIFEINYFVYKWSQDYVTRNLSDFLQQFDNPNFDIDHTLKSCKESFHNKMMHWAKTASDEELPDLFKSKN